MDGTEEANVVVNTMDGNFGDRNSDTEPNLDDDASGIFIFGDVSREPRYNTQYLGYALYRVEYQEDGSVILELVESVNPALTYVEYNNNAIVVTSSGVIRDHDDNSRLVSVNDDTQFLVNEDGVYSTYTIDTLPAYAYGVEVFWTDLNGDGFAERVYIKDFTVAATFGDYIFASSTSRYVVADNSTPNADSIVFMDDVYVDGALRSVYMPKSVADTLLANTGKLYACVDWDEDGAVTSENATYGALMEIALVNEAVDVDAPKADGANYLTTDTGVTITSSAIRTSNITYRITADTIFVGASGLSQADLAKGVWVDATFTGGTGYDADVIYVGTVLNTSTALTVTPKDGTVSVWDSNNAATFNSVKDATSDELTYTVANDNTVIIDTAGKVTLGTGGETIYENNSSRDITVWNEAGNAHADYTLALTWNDRSADTSLASVTVNGSEQNIPAGRANVYDGAFESLSNVTEAFTMNVKANDELAQVRIGMGVDTASAVKNLADRDSVTVQNATDEDCNRIVIEVTAENEDVLYYVYTVDKA